MGAKPAVSLINGLMKHPFCAQSQIEKFFPAWRSARRGNRQTGKCHISTIVGGAGLYIGHPPATCCNLRCHLIQFVRLIFSRKITLSKKVFTLFTFVIFSINIIILSGEDCPLKVVTTIHPCRSPLNVKQTKGEHW